MPSRIGEIITFYSYKGGTGRSMVLANVGYLLSSAKYRNRRVLLIDWDLEAPGLERFFGESGESAGPGLIDYLVQLADRYATNAPDTKLPESVAREPKAVELFRQSTAEHPLQNYITQVDGRPGLYLMRAGSHALDGPRGQDGYWAKVRAFDWEGFYENYGSFFTHFRELLMSRFDYVLIDSRTGLTDIGGICTRVMPEKLVLVFAPNHQNIDGAASVARTSIRYRTASRDPRPLIIFPLAARIDASASKLRTAWWRGGASRGEQITGYQQIFEKLLSEVYRLDECDLGPYFDATQVPYDSDYAYGEAVAAEIDGAEDRLGIGYACDQLARRLVEQTAPWENPDERDYRTDFSISYAGGDRAWAEWVAWQLEEAGYTVELGVWDAAAGQSFITAVGDALQRCRRVVALFSSAYVEQFRYVADEWTMAALHVPGIGQGRLVPVRVETIPAVSVPEALQALEYSDIHGVPENAARKRLLDAVAGPLLTGDEPPLVRGASENLHGRRRPPQLPGSLPEIWNVPQRNPAFTGRADQLAQLRERLASGDTIAVIQSLHGMAGIGKTQLAIEYAYRFSGSYSLAWWINAAQSSLIADQFAALGIALNCIPVTASTEAVRPAVLAELRRRANWLLIFDNAETPAEIRPWLTSGGHVIITSRGHGWQEIATPVELDTLSQQDSAAILSRRLEELPASEADRLAESLGHLPLALSQAAAYLDETRISVTEYLEKLNERAYEILDRESSTSYPRSLAAVIQLSFDRLASDDPVASDVASACAFLAPEPVPVAWYSAAAGTLSGPLAEAAADPAAWRQILTRLDRTALATADRDKLVMHPLTQAVIRAHLDPGASTGAKNWAVALLFAGAPADEDDPATWPQWAELMPHLLALDPIGNSDLGLDSLALRAVRYLLIRGEVATAYDLARQLYVSWKGRRGPDDFATLTAGSYLASAVRILGRYDEARELDEEALAGWRRALGEDDLVTLNSASNLFADLFRLGEYQAARELSEDTLAHRRRVLGEDHPDTLTTASSLAVTMGALGDYQAARDLDEDTLARRRRVLGDDHPATLASASNLAADLLRLGDYQAARDLNEDTLARRRRVLGEDHPDTLISASNLAACLRELGEYRAARDLDEDTVARRRRVLGDDHPDTLSSASALDSDLRRLGRE